MGDSLHRVNCMPIFEFSYVLFVDKGSASSKYCLELRKIQLKHKAVVTKYLRKGHGTNHGIRKGGPTHALTYITSPQSLLSVAQRGDWSMGDVFIFTRTTVMPVISVLDVSFQASTRQKNHFHYYRHIL